MRRTNLRRPPGVDRRAGFTIVEVTIAFAVVGVAVSLLVSSILGLTRARQRATERQQVASTLARTVETLDALGPTVAFVDYGPSPGGEPFPAPGSGAGTPFVVPGLQGIDAPEATVEIEFVTDETLDDPNLGLPRDLDGDGAIADTDVGELVDGVLAANILPVRLRARWRDHSGAPQTVTWSAVIVDD